MIVAMSTIQNALKFGVHSDYSFHNAQCWYLPDGRIYASLVCRSHKSGRSDLRISQVVNSETDLYAWVRSLWYLLEAINNHCANRLL